MTYNVFGGTLSLTQSIKTQVPRDCLFLGALCMYCQLLLSADSGSGTDDDDDDDDDIESVTLTHPSSFIDVAATWVGRYFGMTWRCGWKAPAAQLGLTTPTGL